jgi:hypothetical protein
MANIVTGERYNKLSFVVRGDTEMIKENLKQLGGRWNPNLKNGAGWLFNIKKHTQSVNEFFQKIKKYDVCMDDEFSEVSSDEVDSDETYSHETYSDETCSEDEDEFWEDDKICDYDTVLMGLSTLFVFLAVFYY